MDIEEIVKQGSLLVKKGKMIAMLHENHDPKYNEELDKFLNESIEFVHNIARKLLTIDAGSLESVPDLVADLGRAITFATENGYPVPDRELKDNDFEQLFPVFRGK